MEFKITEAKAWAMARFEAEAGCEISAGPDYGVHLGEVMALALHPVDREKFGSPRIPVEDTRCRLKSTIDNPGEFRVREIAYTRGDRG
jgi:hypothetical protein